MARPINSHCEPTLFAGAAPFDTIFGSWKVLANFQATDGASSSMGAPAGPSGPGDDRFSAADPGGKNAMPDGPPSKRTARQQFEEAAIIAARHGAVTWYPGRLMFRCQSPDQRFSASVWLSAGEVGWSGNGDWRETGIALGLLDPDHLARRVPIAASQGLPAKVYPDAGDPLDAFLAVAVVEDLRGVLSSATLYAAYSQWCERAGRKPRTQTAFVRALRQRGWPQAVRMRPEGGGKQFRGWHGKRCIFVG